MKIRSEDLRAKLESYLDDGETFIGVFENMAMDSARHGLRIAFPFDTAQWDDAVIGKTHAPDPSFDLGWKYILISKTTDVTEAFRILTASPEPGASGGRDTDSGSPDAAPGHNRSDTDSGQLSPLAWLGDDEDTPG